MKSKLLKPIILSLISCCIPISLTSIAANASTITQDSNPQTGSTPITAEVNQSYTVTIPDSYSFGTITRGTGLAYTSAGTISANNIIIPSSKQLNVKLDSSTVYTIKNSSDDTIAYDIYESNSSTTAFTHTNSLITASSGETPSTDYYLGIDQANVNNPGSYTGSIVFVVSIDDTTT